MAVGLAHLSLQALKGSPPELRLLRGEVPELAARPDLREAEVVGVDTELRQRLLEEDLILVGQRAFLRVGAERSVAPSDVDRAFVHRIADPVRSVAAGDDRAGLHHEA